MQTEREATEATNAVYGALRQVQERLDLRNSELITATLGALVRFTPTHNSSLGKTKP